jgi:hypothetical protein
MGIYLFYSPNLMSIWGNRNFIRVIKTLFDNDIITLQ